MKKLLLSLTLMVSGMVHMSAQCTITPGCSVGSNGYCTTPTAGSSLPNATVGTAYNTTIQMSVGTTYSIATITNATITSVSGLPAGMSYSLNPTSGVIPAGGNGCMLITGTPAAGTAGNYTVTANVTANTNFGAFPVTAAWMLTVDPATTTGIKTIAMLPSTIVLAPNPAKSDLNLNADFNFGKIQIIDALGNVVLTHDANYATQATIDVRALNAGVYFLQIHDGTRILTRKFIKE